MIDPFFRFCRHAVFAGLPCGNIIREAIAKAAIIKARNNPQGARNAPLARNEAMMNANEKIEGQAEGRILSDLSQAAPQADQAAPAKAKAKGPKLAKDAGKRILKAEGKAKGKKGADARIAAQFAAAEKAAKAKQSKALSPGSDIAKDAEYHFSGLAHNMPSASDIEKAEGLCKRMIGRDLERYKQALKGNLPIGEFDGAPIDLNLQTHAGYKGKWKALKALIDAGDLKALESWNGGLGIRQNSSSSKPLGRFHQCAILAMRAKAAAKAKRQAGKAAKNGEASQPSEAPSQEGGAAQA